MEFCCCHHRRINLYAKSLCAYAVIKILSLSGRLLHHYDEIMKQFYFTFIQYILQNRLNLKDISINLDQFLAQLSACGSSA